MGLPILPYYTSIMQQRVDARRRSQPWWQSTQAARAVGAAAVVACVTTPTALAAVAAAAAESPPIAGAAAARAARTVVIKPCSGEAPHCRQRTPCRSSTVDALHCLPFASRQVGRDRRVGREAQPHRSRTAW